MTDLWEEFGHWDKVESALHGDLRPLVALLRSDEPLTKCVRQYIADEIERAPDRRFRRQRKEDLSVKERDKWILYATWRAKLQVAAAKVGEGNEEALQRAMEAAQDEVSYQEALDHLSAQGLEIDEDDLKNALRRAPPTMFSPRPRRKSAE